MATIKDLIGIGPDELAKLTDEELAKRCEPYLTIPAEDISLEDDDEEDKQGELVSLDGAPDRAQRTTAKRAATKKSNREQMLAELAELAKLHGVDINIPTKIK